MLFYYLWECIVLSLTGSLLMHDVLIALDSDVPPLEDMSVMLQERASLQQQYQQKSRVSQESKAESTEYNKKEGNNVKSAQVCYICWSKWTFK